MICLSLSLHYGAITAAITELFDYEIRATCLSVGFSLSVMLFGAFAQFFVTLLIEYFSSPIAITIYPLMGVALSLVAVIFYKESFNTDKITQHFCRLSVSETSLLRSGTID